MLDNLKAFLEAKRLQEKLQNKFSEFSKTFDLSAANLEQKKQNRIAVDDAEISSELERLKREIQTQGRAKKQNTSNQNSDRLHARLDRDKINLCYSIFGLKPGASLIEVKQAHRKLIKKYHPDLFFDNPQRQQQAEEMMKKINKAYTKICNHINKERSHL